MLTNSDKIDFTKDSRAASCSVGLFDVVNLRTKSDSCYIRLLQCCSYNMT